MPKDTQKKKFWQRLESVSENDAISTDQALAALHFDENGLLPVVTQCADSRQVLMLAWMNREALQKTLTSGRMTYYSRSRQQLWLKGETSGNIQELLSLTADCDGDTLLACVRQVNAACHSGRRSCFYVQLSPTARATTVDKDSG